MGVVSNKVNITELQKGGGGTGDLPGRVTALETVVGDSTSGLVKDVDDLETVVGDESSGLVKDVDDLKGSASTIYSTTEKVIGEWIDGKPIYQKTISFTLESTTTDGNPVTNNILITSLNIDNVISANGFIKGSSDIVQIGSYINLNPTMPIVGVISWIGYDDSSVTLLVRHNRKSYNGANGHITLQYTKTTD